MFFSSQVGFPEKCNVLLKGEELPPVAMAMDLLEGLCELFQHWNQRRMVSKQLFLLQTARHGKVPRSELIIFPVDVCYILISSCFHTSGSAFDSAPLESEVN